MMMGVTMVVVVVVETRLRRRDGVTYRLNDIEIDLSPKL